MSRKKGRVLELETQIRNLKVKQGRILKASRNNHIGLLHWKSMYFELVKDIEEQFDVKVFDNKYNTYVSRT